MISYRIPFNRAVLTGKEFSFIGEALANGHISGDGPFTRRCQNLLRQQLGTAGVLLTTSCTHALEMCALLLDLQPGDEVIVPSFTFVSTANAFALRGCRIVFCDIRPDTLNLNEALLGELITPRTRALVPVHYAGVGCEMDQIVPFARQRGIVVVEDNAHGLYGKYHGHYLGTLGCLATQSFHETKNVTCGEGGALLINDPRYLDRAEIIREKGTNRSRFFRGQVDKYSWVDTGSSYVISDILAAFLYSQILASETIQSRRQRIWQRYATALESWARSEHIRLPIVPAHCENAYHMFYLLVPSLDSRQRLIAHLKDHGIFGVFHYLPLHLSDFGSRFGGRAGDCPVTESVSDRILRLPFYNDMDDAAQDQVLDALFSFRT